MSTPAPTKTMVAADLDALALAELNILIRQRELANRKLLKRRRQKSGQ